MKILYALLLLITVCYAINDCNNNSIDDHLDILNLKSNDCNYNGIPDECEHWNKNITKGCNGNFILESIQFFNTYTSDLYKQQ